jgi:phospholipase/carboxylesterase
VSQRDPIDRSKELPLVHLARPPRAATADRPPLLLQLHGKGSNERDLFRFADLLDPRFLVLSVRAPIVRGPDSFAWFDVQFFPEGFAINPEQLRDQLRDSRDRIVQFIGEATAIYGVDPQRIYLLGFSQGAVMSLTTMLTSPATVAGVAALSGRIPAETLPWIAPGEELAGMPVLVAHGTADQVISIQHARSARQVLERLPVELTYREYNMPHTISDQTLSDTSEWLTAHLDAPRRAHDGAQ